MRLPIVFTRQPRRPRTADLRVGFFGVLGAGSLGNDGCLDAIVNYLREYHPDVKLRFLVMGPTRMEERYGAPATSLQWYEANLERFQSVPSPVLKIIGRILDPFRALLWTREVDLAIVPGMGVLETTIPMRPWGFPYGLYTVCAAARISGTRVAMVCVGADVIHKRISRMLITGAARLAHYRSYRDHNSLEAMRTMGIDVDDDRVYPDLAFGHPVPSTAPDGSGTVGLGLMDYWGNNDERAQADRLRESYIGTMTQFAGWLLDHGRPIRFLLCDPVDTTVINRVIDDLRSVRPELPASMIIFEPAETLQALMKQMAGVDAVVATRYHNVVSAVQLGLPTISISYSRKHDEVMSRMGLREFCQPARSVDFARLVQQFTDLERRSDVLTGLMSNANEQNVKEVQQQYAAVSALLASARTGSAATS